MKTKLLRILVSCCMVVTILSASCTKDTAATDENQTPAETTGATYREADILYTAPEGYDVEAYYLTVPEDHNKPDGRTIDIYFSIYRTQADVAEPDPLVYLAGGPGEHANEAASLMFDSRYAPLMKNRDLIIVDQRGTGYSDPALDCPEVMELFYQYLDSNNDEESRVKQIEALQTSYDRFTGEGIDLSAYNSAQSAADLNDLRIALGYEEWNVLGVSYGTRLALTMLRDHPQGIRSVILCSSYPLQVDLYASTPANINRALDVLFAACAANPESNAAYPDLETQFYASVKKLNDSPVSVKITHPLTRKVYDVLIDGDSLIDTVISSLYSTEVLPLLPKLITDAGEGKLDMLALLMSSDFVNMELVSLGMHYSVQFNEELPFTDQAKVDAAVAAFPKMKEFFENNFSTDGDVFTIYNFWHSGEASAIENEPVTSDVPTLVISGEFDPITPPAWGQTVSETLTNSYYYLVPGTGHDTIFSPNQCIMDMALNFLDDPEAAPDSSCVQQVEEPAFITMNVQMEPLLAQTYGFTSLYPAGWEEIAEGAYQRSGLGITALVEQSLPNVDKATLVGLLANSLGLDTNIQPDEELTANDMDWSIYQVEVQTLATDIAVTESNGVCYFILFSCVPDDHEYYYANLVLPAVKALKAIPK